MMRQFFSGLRDVLAEWALKGELRCMAKQIQYDCEAARRRLGGLPDNERDKLFSDTMERSIASLEKIAIRAGRLSESLEKHCIIVELYNKIGELKADLERSR